ncbi:MAG: hypothetical protein PHY77_03360 [Desulfotomaculaceae bacterium]|nr:hypothetical protein [Desulfotomaculaceae bacterium]
MDLTDVVPTDLIPTGVYSFSGTGSHTTPSFVGQNIFLTVTQLAPGESLVFNYDILVSPSVSSGENYTNQAILQQPYSQNNRSFQYPGSPFTGQTTLKAPGITLTKLISPTFAKIGDIVTYILQATVPQGTTAYQVQVIDNYPPVKQSYIAGSGIPVPASVVPGTVTFPTVPFVDATVAAVTLLFQFQVRVTSASLSSPYRENQTDSATVKWDLDNSGTHATPFTTTANLQVRVPRLTARKEQRNVTQSGIYGTANVNYNIGDTISYRITLSNLGPAEAFNIQFTDTLDPLLSFDAGSITTTSGSASFAAGVISWNIPQINVAPGSATLIFTVTTLPGVPADGRIPDSGTISSYNTNNNGFGISLGPVSTNIVQLVSPAVIISKTSSLAAGEIGDDITYTLTITVPSGTIAYAPIVDDTLPIGQTYIGPAYRQELPNPAVLVSNIGSGLNVLFPTNLDIDASAGAKTIIYTFVARITSATHNPPYSETQTNTGRVRWRISPGGTIRTATKTLPITARTPHITILKEQSLDGISYTTANLSGLPGDTVYYRLTINSDGASPAFDINLSDVLSTRITFQSITSGPTAGANVLPLPGPGPDGTLNWNIPQLNVGNTGILVFTATINSGIGAGDSFSNTATATYDSNDVNPITYTQNANQITFLIQNLEVIKTVSTPVAAIGDTLTYTLTINIPSGVLAYNLVIVDRLPMGQQYVPGSWLPPLPAPVVVGNQITFTDPVTPETGPQTLVYTFQSLVISGQTAPPYTETQHNNACITWDITSSGPTAPPVCSFVDVEVTSPHLVSLKEQRNASIPGSQFTTDLIPGVTIGDTIEYRITLTNNGLNTAYTNVTTDVLDNDITYTGIYSLTPAGGTVISSVAPGNPDGALTWTQTTPILAGDTAVLVFSVMETTGSAPGTTVQNNASTIYKSNPANLGNLGPALSNTVGFDFSPPAITKAVDHPNVFVGDTLTYTVSITIPKGNIAYDVQVSDVLPANQSYIPNSLTRNTIPIIPSPTLTFPAEGTINATLADETITYTFQTTVDTITSSPQEIQTDNASITYNLAEGGPAGPTQNASVDVFVTDSSITVAKAQRNFTTGGAGPFTQIPPIQVSVGDVVHYQLTVGNPSLSNTIYHVNVFDILSSLLQYIGPLNPPPVGFITESGGTVTWAIDSIPPNTSYNAIVAVTILPGGGSGDTIPDTLNATFAATNISPDVIYGPLTSNTVLAQLTSLSLQKTVDSTVAVLGQFLTYTLTLIVPNGTIAYNVVVTDTLPSQQLYGDTATKNGIEISPTVTGQVITFPSEPILDASTGELVITYQFLSRIVMANDSSPYTEIQANSTQVNWDIDSFGTPATPANADQDVMVSRPLVVLEKLQRNVTQGTGFMAIPISVEVGDTVRFSLRVDNIGASTAYNVVVSDFLEPFAQFAGINNVTAGTAIYDTMTSTVIWTLATIPPGGSEYLLFDMIVLPGVSAGGSNANAATAFYDTDLTTPITIGPVDSDTVYQEYPNIQISKIANVANTVVGAVITYTVSFTLPNGTVAYNAQFTDILPVGQEYNNNAKLNGQPITPAEVNGQFIAFPIIPYVSAVGGTYTDIYQFDALVVSAAVDPFTFVATQTNSAMGNWYLDPDTPAPPVDALMDIHVTDGTITITKEQRNATEDGAFTTLPISGKMNQIIEYHLAIFNPSPRVLYDIIIEDLLPSDLAFNSVVSVSVGTLTHSGETANGTVTWSLGTLASNDPAVAIFSVKILSNKTTIVTNNAQGTFLIDPESPNRFGTIISNTVILNITSPPRGISLMNWEDQLVMIEFSLEI